MNTHILTDEELISILENDKQLSSEEDFDGSSDDSFIGSLVDDFYDMAELEGGNSNNILENTFLDISTINEVSNNSLSTEL